MNKETAKDYLPLVQALSDGKVLQFKGCAEGCWTNVNELKFNYSPSCYRIKPEPKEIWVVEHKGGLFDAFTTKSEAEHLSIACHSRLSLYREVVE